MNKSKNKTVLTGSGMLRKLPEEVVACGSNPVLESFAREVRPELWVHKRAEPYETLGGVRIGGSEIESPAAESPCLDIAPFCRKQVDTCSTLHEASVRARQALLRYNSPSLDKLVFEAHFFADEVLWYGPGARFREGLYLFHSRELITVWGDLRVPLWCGNEDTWTRLLKESLTKLEKAYAVWDEVRAKDASRSNL